MDGVVVDMHLPDHPLVEEPRHFPQAGAERHKPLVVVGGAPVRCEDRRRCEEPAMLEVPRHEVLRQKLVYAGASLVAGERPDVVGEDSDGPVFRLHEQDNRRSRAPFALAERRVGGGRDQEGRPDTPDQFAGMSRGQEECRVQITESVGSSLRRRVSLPVSQMTVAT